MNELEQRRSSWLKMAKSLVVSLIRRDSILSEVMCPMMPLRDPTEKQEALRGVAKLSKEIADVSERMALIENGDPYLGARALLDEEGVDVPVRSAVALLIAARHDHGFTSDIIGEIVKISSGQDPVAAEALRRQFQFAEGSIRPHVRVVRSSPSLDEWHVAIRESSLALALGREPDGELVGLELTTNQAVNSKRFE
jgi:hypothetical protein